MSSIGSPQAVTSGPRPEINEAPSARFMRRASADLPPAWLHWMLLALAGTVLLVIPLLFVPSMFAPSATPRTVLIGLVAPSLLALYVAAVLLSGSELQIRRPWLPVAGLALLGWSLLSTGWTPDRLEAGLANLNLIALLSWFALIVLVVRNARHAVWLLSVAALSAGLVSVVGILQRFGIDVPPFAQTLQPGSTFVYANVGGQFIAMLVPLTLLLAVRSNRWRSLIAWGIVFLLSAAYLVFTRCRGAWLGAGVGMVVATVLIVSCSGLRGALWQRFTRSRLVAAGGLVVALGVGLAVMPPGGESGRRTSWSEMLASFFEPFQRLAVNQQSGTPTSSDMRWHLLGSAVRAWQEHGWTGVGVAGYRSGIVPHLDQATAKLNYTPTVQMLTLHCDPLQLALEMGVVGVVAVGVIVGHVLVSSWRMITRRGAEPAGWVVLACLAGLVAVSVHSLVSFPFHMPTSALMAVTLAGIVLGLSTKDQSSGVPESGSTIAIRGRSTQAAIFSLVVIAAIVSVSGHYRFGLAMQAMREAWVAKELKQAPVALEQIDKAMAIDDSHFTIRREYGVIHTRFNPDRLEALQACLRALRNDPYYINNLVNAAGVEMELGMLATARQRLEKTLAINDELHLAWYALGLIHQRQGRVEAAREAFQACVDIADFDLAQAQLRALPPTR